jgi:hypothetical protein
VSEIIRRRFTFEEREGIRVFTRNPCTPKEEYFCRVTDNSTGETREIVISSGETTGLGQQELANLFSSKFSSPKGFR